MDISYEVSAASFVQFGVQFSAVSFFQIVCVYFVLSNQSIENEKINAIWEWISFCLLHLNLNLWFDVLFDSIFIVKNWRFCHSKAKTFFFSFFWFFRFFCNSKSKECNHQLSYNFQMKNKWFWCFWFCSEVLFIFFWKFFIIFSF